MSDAENPFPPLPDAKTFLEGKDGIKPLQHRAEALIQFAAGFEEVPLAPSATEKVVQLGETMKKPHWAGAHDAAYEALTGAKNLVAEGGELASHAYAVESIFNSRAPNVHTVKGIKHPVFEEALKPLTTYLEEFGTLITGWAWLSPSRMKAKEADTAITPAQHRVNNSPPAVEARPSLTILPLPPQEGSGHVHSPGCNHHHGSLIPPITPEATPSDGHVHGANCNHDHPTPPQSSSDSCHVHGPGCGHDHAPNSSSRDGVHYHGDTPCSHSHAPSGGAHEPHLPKGKSNAGWWVAVAAVGVGAYLINEYGKPKKKEAADKPADWKQRVESAQPTEGRYRVMSEAPINVLSPEEIERQKTKQQHAEDIAYTINHSLYCTLTDFLNPPINAATDGYLRWLIPGCGHDHSKDGGHHHHDHAGHCTHPDHHHPPSNLSRWEKVKLASKQAFSKERFVQYAKGEFIGDFGAVPLTIGVQRMFPNFMNGLRKLSEPIMRPLFKWGVEQDNKDWARKHNIIADSQEYKDHAAKVYEYEMSHFPQAVVWTGFSLGLNTAYQMFTDKSHMPFASKLALKSSSVLSGVLVTAGVVVAARALAPNKMHSFDTWTGENAILPATKAVGKLFGVKEEDVERMAEKDKQIREEAWTTRVVEPSEQSTDLSI